MRFFYCFQLLSALDGHSLGTPKWESQYARVYPFDRWFLFFEHPPTAQNVYEKMCYFKFEVTQDDEYLISTHVVYDSDILEDEWVAAFGEKPSKRFVQRKKGIERPSHEVIEISEYLKQMKIVAHIHLLEAKKEPGCHVMKFKGQVKEILMGKENLKTIEFASTGHFENEAGSDPQAVTDPQAVLTPKQLLTPKQF